MTRRPGGEQTVIKGRANKDIKVGKVKGAKICVSIGGDHRPDMAVNLLLRGSFGLLAEEAGVKLFYSCSKDYEPRVDVVFGEGRRPDVLFWYGPGLFDWESVKSGNAVPWAGSIVEKGSEVLENKLDDESRATLEKNLLKKLFSGTRYNRSRLHVAMLAGLEWMIYDALGGDYGKLSDYLQVFYILRESAASKALRNIGRFMSNRLSLRYKKIVKVPGGLNPPEKLYDAAAGLFLIKALGRRHDGLRRALTRFFAVVTRKKQIPGIGKRWRNSAKSVLDSLVDLYFVHELGLPCPVPFKEVVARALEWNYKDMSELNNEEFDIQTYLVTHIIYVLSDFNLYELNSDVFLPEENYLKSHLDYYVSIRDVETVGEFGDCFKILGRSYETTHVRKIVSSLLEWQNEDGSWGDVDEGDSYVRYHSTWTGFNGLLEFEFQKKGPEKKWMQSLLKERAKNFVRDDGG